ncbi:YceD family protein [Pedobacter sp. UC225_61]|uniref:YceD family protein n=1 Tax=Pedobacter sp. UC225_61 TaxID=3374623 RepID=UPI0037B6C703
MKALKQFSIPFTGLKLGKHQFDFEIDKSFFDAFEYSLVKDGALKVEVELDKQETMLILHFHIWGTIQLNCDKCLAEFSQPIEINEGQIVKFAEDDLESDDLEIIMLNKKESALDVSEMIYEFINVSVPYINNCEQAGQGQKCDPEMIATLEKLASGTADKEEEQNDDPRWEALKKLK